MKRFEILEIACQNPDGVTYFAVDSINRQSVELHRFFPFGLDYVETQESWEVSSLNPQEAEVFSITCERLSVVSHPALRTTIFGSVDPIDGIPYIVTEWTGEETLASLLGDKAMKPSMVIDLIRQALEVCQVLSHSLGNEAVWIDTKPESIIVRNASENPSFVFGICPFKILDAPSHAKDMTSIVCLVESLTGSKSKSVGNSASHGLGKWLKLMSKSPQKGLRHALKSLPDSSNTPSKRKKAALIPPCKKPSDRAGINQSFSHKKIIVIMALAACFTALMIVYLYQDQPKGQQVAVTEIPIFFPDETESIAKIPTAQPAMLKAVVKSIIISRNNSSIYFAFSEPWNRKEIGVIIDPKNFEGGPYNRQQMLQNKENFGSLVGKAVTFEGTVWRYGGRPEPHFILVKNRNQIRPED